MNVINAIVAWLSSAPFLHLAGIVAVSVLLGIGTLTVEEGFPILVGLVGLGINTTTGNSSPKSGVSQ